MYALVRQPGAGGYWKWEHKQNECSQQFCPHLSKRTLSLSFDQVPFPQAAKGISLVGNSFPLQAHQGLQTEWSEDRQEVEGGKDF